MKSRLFLRGLAVIDKRTAAARVYVTTRQALLEHLGGPGAVSETQAQLVELVARGLLYIGHLDAVLLERRTILNKKKTKVLPLVTERMRMAEGLTRQLQALGLERRSPSVPTLETYVQARYGAENGGRLTGGGGDPDDQPATTLSHDPPPQEAQT
jgi:hypothetical protein